MKVNISLEKVGRSENISLKVNISLKEVGGRAEYKFEDEYKFL